MGFVISAFLRVPILFRRIAFRFATARFFAASFVALVRLFVCGFFLLVVLFLGAAFFLAIQEVYQTSRKSRARSRLIEPAGKNQLALARLASLAP